MGVPDKLLLQFGYNLLQQETMFVVLVLLSVTIPCLSQPAQPLLLPTYMLGDFKMESSKGFNNAMWELGVDWFTRQIANALYPLQKIRQDQTTGEISLDTETTFKSSYTKFKLLVPWEEYTLDKRTTTTVSKLEGNKLIKDQVPPASTGYHTTREVREFKDEDQDGSVETMVYTLTIKGHPEATTERIYKRVVSK